MTLMILGEQYSNQTTMSGVRIGSGGYECVTSDQRPYLRGSDNYDHILGTARYTTTASPCIGPPPLEAGPKTLGSRVFPPKVVVSGPTHRVLLVRTPVDNPGSPVLTLSLPSTVVAGRTRSRESVCFREGLSFV